MAILRIRDESGKVVDVYALKGEKGDTGSFDDAGLDTIIAIQENLINGKEITPVDYIIEQGVSGAWTYRKWASGVAEAWCNTSAYSVAPDNWNQSGSVYILKNPLSLELPANVFLPNSGICSQVQERGYGSYVVSGSVAELSEQYNRVYWGLMRHWTDNGTYNLYFNISLKGRWV